VILVGDFPFKGRDLNNLYKNIRTQVLKLDIPELSQVSNTCKDLINKLLEKESEKRIGSDDALLHEWFRGDLAETKVTLDEAKTKSVISNLNNYKNESKLNKAIKMFNFKLSSTNNDILKLRDLFLQADANKNGVLEREEF